MLDSLRSRWLQVGRWPRLLAAATCLLLALLSALGAARDRAVARRPVRTVPVVVAARAIGAGQLLHAADLRVERWPTSLDPPHTPPDPRAIIGRRSAGALSAREPVTASRILGAGIATGLGAGLGAVPVEVAAGRAADYVRAGDHVDVLAGPPDTAVGGDTGDSGDSGSAELVAGDAAVLGVLPGSDGTEAVVIIGADRATALRVARQESSRTFTVVVISL